MGCPLPHGQGSVFLLAAVLCQAQIRPEFEVASVKPSAGGEESFMVSKSAGTFTAQKVTLRALIEEAYGVKADQIYGGPDWIASDGWDVSAKREVGSKEGLFNREVMWVDIDQRLQRLLEDRCRLKVHRETRQLPVYAVTVAKGGLRVQPASCVSVNGDDPPPQLEPGQPRPHYCGNSNISRNGLNAIYTGTGITMKDMIAFWLSNAMDRTVLDKTGYSEKFNATVEWAPRDTADGPSIFTALQEQLGLKLESTKGPVEVLVIDHLEKPSAN
jgi:uncharacterized protein (TIGR03435 family)